MEKADRIKRDRSNTLSDKADRRRFRSEETYDPYTGVPAGKAIRTEAEMWIRVTDDPVGSLLICNCI